MIPNDWSDSRANRGFRPQPLASERIQPAQRLSLGGQLRRLASPGLKRAQRFRDHGDVVRLRRG